MTENILSYPHSSPPRKSYYPEKERTKIMQERDTIISNFVNKFITNPQSGQYYPNIRVKNYLDGSKYEGELSTSGKYI